VTNPFFKRGSCVVFFFLHNVVAFFQHLLDSTQHLSGRRKKNKTLQLNVRRTLGAPVCRGHGNQKKWGENGGK
jgi:hypothetical protein